MSLSDLYRPGSPGLSIELFPPKSPEGDAAMWEAVEKLTKFRPGFVSCTYGAGGSTRDRTLDICQTLKTRHGVNATAHLTCVGSTVDDLRGFLRQAQTFGVANIMALRGDPPAGETTFKKVEGGFRNANELVSLIRGEFPNLGIGVAGYPEVHQECADAEIDLNHLKRKVDAGADAVFTQLFFVNDKYLRFRDRCELAGIRVPIVPGIMPILNFAQIKRIATLCRAEFPTALASRLEAVQDDKDAQFAVGVEYSITQCQELLSRGAPGLHFYVLNKAQACEQILQGLGRII